jgi:predicted transcriptional regulator
MKAIINNYNPDTGFCDIRLGYKIFELEGMQEAVDKYVANKRPPKLIWMGFDVWQNHRDNMFKYMTETIKKSLQEFEDTKDIEKLKKNLQELHDLATMPIVIA